MYATTRTARILLIEDDAKLRETIAEGLRLEDWEVMCTESGHEALRWLNSEVFDLLLLEGMLPDFDGLEFVRAVRARGLQLPVLFVSAGVSPLERTLALQNGATDFIAKPFGFFDLLERCRALLRPD